MKCCGQEQYTAFCPDCGRKIGGEPITEIITHVKGMLSRIEKHQARGIVWEKEHPDRVDEYRHVQNRNSTERKIEKFKRWLKALELAQTKKQKSGASSDS